MNGPPSPPDEALAGAIDAAVWAALAPLRSPRVRGPFPHPTAADLARPAYLARLAAWCEAAVRRSRRHLGADRVRDALQAAGRLARAADLLAERQTAADPASADALATAALAALQPPASRPARGERLGSRALDLMGYVGEIIRSARAAGRAAP